MDMRLERIGHTRAILRALLLTCVAALAATPIYGMGTAGGGRQGSASQIKASFTDADGTRVEASEVTAAGVLELPGELGRGYLRIPLDSIAKVEFSGEDRARRKAAITLRGGESVEVQVRGSLTFYGRTSAGTYQISARDLKAIEFAQ